MLTTSTILMSWTIETLIILEFLQPFVNSYSFSTPTTFHFSQSCVYGNNFYYLLSLSIQTVIILEFLQLFSIPTTFWIPTTFFQIGGGGNNVSIIFFWTGEGIFVREDFQKSFAKILKNSFVEIR